MKSSHQYVAEHNAKANDIESQYTEVRDFVGKALNRAMALRSAIISFELKVNKATAEFHEELRTVEENFK